MDHHGKLDYGEAWLHSCEHLELPDLHFSRNGILLKARCGFVLGGRQVKGDSEYVGYYYFPSLTIPATDVSANLHDLFYHAKLVYVGLK